MALVHNSALPKWVRQPWKRYDTFLGSVPEPLSFIHLFNKYLSSYYSRCWESKSKQNCLHGTDILVEIGRWIYKKVKYEK